MTAYKGFKFRLCSTEEQTERINKTLGCCRAANNILKKGMSLLATPAAS